MTPIPTTLPFLCGLLRLPITASFRFFAKDHRGASFYSRLAHTFVVAPLFVVGINSYGYQARTPADLLWTSFVFFLGRGLSGMIENSDAYNEANSGRIDVASFLSFGFVLLATTSDFCSTAVFATSLTLVPHIFNLA